MTSSARFLSKTLFFGFNFIDQKKGCSIIQLLLIAIIKSSLQESSNQINKLAKIYIHDSVNYAFTSPGLVQVLSLIHRANDDQLLQLVRISCPRLEAQLNSSSLTRLCLFNYLLIPPRLDLFVARVSGGHLLTFYHT